MTSTNEKNLALEYLTNLPDRLPRVVLDCYPPVATPGTNIQLTLISKEKLAADIQLTIELSLDEEILLTIPVQMPAMTAQFTVPETLTEGYYDLRVLYKGRILDSTVLEIAEQDFAEQAAIFAQALDTEAEVLGMINNGEYAQAIELNQKVAEAYQASNYPELAAKSWQQLGEVLLKAKNYQSAKQVLEKSLDIYNNIDDLDNREYTINNVEKQIRNTESIIQSNDVIEIDNPEKLAELFGIHEIAEANEPNFSDSQQLIEQKSTEERQYTS